MWFRGQAPSQAGNRIRPQGSDFRVMKDTCVQGSWSLPPWWRRATEARHVEEEWVPSRRPWDAFVWSSLSEDWIALETPQCWRCLNYGTSCQGKPQTGVAPAQEDRKCVNVVQSAKLEGWSHLRPLTSEKELQDLKFALLAFSLTYALWSSISSLCPHSCFRTAIYAACHCVL